MKTSQQQQGPAKKRNYRKLERMPACLPNGGFGWMAWPLAAPPLETSTKSISRTLTEHRCTPGLHTSIYSLLRWWPLIVTEVQGEYKVENIRENIFWNVPRELEDSGWTLALNVTALICALKWVLWRRLKRLLYPLQKPALTPSYIETDTDIRRRIRQTQHRLRLYVSFCHINFPKWQVCSAKRLIKKLRSGVRLQAAEHAAPLLHSFVK